jgi:FkbM family methyltransferase
MSLQLNKNVLNKRVFKQEILDLHIREFMLGQTFRYMDKQHSAIDVGGATGMYASYFARFAKNVHSFEAVTPVYNQLEKVKKLYPNIITYNKAVSKENGTADFYVDDKRLSNSSFQNLVNGQKITVPTITLDSLGFSDVNFIKIDVEGCELDVLYGAKKLIEDYKPTCMVEVYEKFNKYSIETTFEFFYDKNYKCFYNKRARGLIKVPTVSDAIKSVKEKHSEHDGDFLFVYE